MQKPHFLNLFRKDTGISVKIPVGLALLERAEKFAEDPASAHIIMSNLINIIAERLRMNNDYNCHCPGYPLGIINTVDKLFTKEGWGRCRTPIVSTA